MLVPILPTQNIMTSVGKPAGVPPTNIRNIVNRGWYPPLIRPPPGKVGVGPYAGVKQGRCRTLSSAFSRLHDHQEDGSL